MTVGQAPTPTTAVTAVTAATAAMGPITAVIGRGRMGSALATAMPHWHGPFGRGADGTIITSEGTKVRADVIVLAVPDSEIARAAGVLVPGAIVGHTAGAIGLDVLAPHECFGVHPLMTVPRSGADFGGAGAAIAGSTERALHLARSIASDLGMRPFEIADVDRPAYHAAASIASNFLVTLEDAAEALLATTGGDRQILVPLVRAAMENWAEQGGPAALTGPIARGDQATVARQRAAVADRAPELLAMFDIMCERTAALATRQPRSGPDLGRHQMG